MANEENMNVEEVEFITLEFDDGSKEECEILGIFDVEGNPYIALLPDGKDEEVYLYGYKELEEEDAFELLDIEDDALFEKVSDEFEKIMDQQDLGVIE